MPAHQLGTPLPLAAKFDTSKQEATNYAFPDPRALGIPLGSFLVSLAPLPVWTYRKCWLLLTVLCVSVFYLVSEEMRPMKFFVEFQGGGAYFYATCQRCSCMLLFSLIPCFRFAFFHLFPPGVIRINL